MKKALVILAKKIEEAQHDAKFVLNIHDEWQLDCAEVCAEAVGKAAVESIREAGDYFKFRCPLDGEYKIGNNWKDTH